MGNNRGTIAKMFSEVSDHGQPLFVAEKQAFTGRSGHKKTSQSSRQLEIGDGRQHLKMDASGLVVRREDGGKRAGHLVDRLVKIHNVFWLRRMTVTSIQQNFIAGTWWLGGFGKNSFCSFSEGIGDHSSPKFAPIRRTLTRVPHNKLTCLT